MLLFSVAQLNNLALCAKQQVPSRHAVRDAPDAGIQQLQHVWVNIAARTEAHCNSAVPNINKAGHTGYLVHGCHGHTTEASC